MTPVPLHVLNTEIAFFTTPNTMTIQYILDFIGYDLKQTELIKYSTSCLIYINRHNMLFAYYYFNFRIMEDIIYSGVSLNRLGNGKYQDLYSCIFHGKYVLYYIIPLILGHFSGSKSGTCYRNNSNSNDFHLLSAYHVPVTPLSVLYIHKVPAG